MSGGTLSRVVRVYRVILGLAFSTAKGKALALFFTAGIVGMFGAITGLITKLVVDALAGGDPGAALAIGVLYLVLYGVGALMEDVSALLQSDLGERTSQAVELKLMEISSSAAGLEHLERPEYADKVKLVKDRSYIPYFAFTNLNGLSSIVFGLTAAVVLLGFVHPLLILLPVVVAPGVVIQFQNYRKHFKRHDSTAPDERLAKHYLELATEPAAAKEVRLFGLGPELIQRHRRLTDTYNGMLFGDQLKRAWAGVAAGGRGQPWATSPWWCRWPGWRSARSRVRPARPRGWPSCRSSASATCGSSTTGPAWWSSPPARRRRRRSASRPACPWRTSPSPIPAPRSRC
jgi:ATP-binding cassette subfamily B protein